MVKRAEIDRPTDPLSEQLISWGSSLCQNSNGGAQKTWQAAQKLLQSVFQKYQAEPQKADSLPNAANTNLLDSLDFGMEMCEILAVLEVDPYTSVSALLCPLLDAGYLTTTEIAERCSDKVARRLSGVESMNAIRSLQAETSEQQDAAHLDNLRKMLLVMVDDVRVVLLKLAERLCALRKAKNDDLKRPIVAREVMDIYAPLANRLGLGQLKWEMEDLAFRYLNTSDYKAIAKHLAEKRIAREDYVSKVLQALEDAIADLHIKADVMGRAKHIYSIWKKMQRKQVGFEEIYDVRAVRVLVPEIQDCYSVLGIVHGLWQHIPKEFDDYVATPKENGYRSLHTAVVGPEGKTLEIQIRTFEMHQESELGVAAHWRYKEGGQADGYESKIAWLRQLLEWQEDVAEHGELADEFKNQVVDERIYVFTPQGRLIDLPRGATAVDFAYRVHTEIGHRCRGAKVNGRIVQLSHSLETGQKVEILTAKTGGPSRDWLVEDKGYIRSARARHKVNQWFRLQDKDKNAIAGKQLLEKELSKHNIKVLDVLKLAKHFNYNNEDELYAGIGVGDKGLHQVINSVRSLFGTGDSKKKTEIKRSKARTSGGSDILVEGVGNLLTRMAACCKPAPGDEIAGYVTQSRGVVIHRADCSFFLQASKRAPERVLQVDWADSLESAYKIDLLVKAWDRKGLLGDVTGHLAAEKVSVTGLRTHVNPKRLMVNIHLQIEVPNVESVSRLMTQLEQLPNVVSVARK